MKTIKDIKVGDKFFNKEYSEEHIEGFVVTEIIKEKDGGEPVKDMWGSVVWNKPMYTIKCKSLTDGHESGLAVQDEDSDLSSWNDFYSTEKERKEITYRYRRQRYLSKLKSALDIADKETKAFPLYGDCMDEYMVDVIKKVDELRDAIMYANILT